MGQQSHPVIAYGIPILSKNLDDYDWVKGIRKYIKEVGPTEACYDNDEGEKWYDQMEEYFAFKALPTPSIEYIDNEYDVDDGTIGEVYLGWDAVELSEEGLRPKTIDRILLGWKDLAWISYCTWG